MWKYVCQNQGPRAKGWFHVDFNMSEAKMVYIVMARFDTEPGKKIQTPARVCLIGSLVVVLAGLASASVRERQGMRGMTLGFLFGDFLHILQGELFEV